MARKVKVSQGSSKKMQSDCAHVKASQHAEWTQLLNDEVGIADASEGAGMKQLEGNWKIEKRGDESKLWDAASMTFFKVMRSTGMSDYHPSFDMEVSAQEISRYSSVFFTTVRISQTMLLGSWMRKS